MSSKKKLDPSMVSQSISIPTPAKQDPAAHVPSPAVATAPKEAEQNQLNSKGRYETSFRFNQETKTSIARCLDACWTRPSLANRIIQKNLLELGPYGLSLLDSKDLKDAYYAIPVPRTSATFGAPLRLSAEYHQRVMIPLIQKYSDSLKTTKGANVSRMVVLGIHYLDSIRQRDNEEFLDYIEELCDRQYDEGLHIC